MGKQLVIPGADFSANGIIPDYDFVFVLSPNSSATITVNGTTYSISNTTAKSREIGLNVAGTVTNINSLCKNQTSVEKVKINKDLSSLTYCTEAFRGANKLKEVDLSATSLSSANSSFRMFQGCTILEKIKLPSQALFKAPTYFFISSKNLAGVDFSQFAFSGDLGNGFQETSVERFNGIDTSAVTKMAYAFASSYAVNLDLSEFNTSGVSTMAHMFDGATLLRTITLGANFSMTSSTTATDMFKGCRVLETINATQLLSSSETISALKSAVSGSANVSNSISLICADATLTWDGTSWS